MLKKALWGALSASLLATSVMAATDADRFQDMRDMEAAMTTIQKGFLFTDKALVKEGVSKLKASNKMDGYTDEALKDYLPKDKKALYRNSHKQAKSINVNADAISAALEKKEYGKAHKAYAEILNACTHCHLIVRNWK